MSLMLDRHLEIEKLEDTPQTLQSTSVALAPVLSHTPLSPAPYKGETKPPRRTSDSIHSSV
jgi:hypothetical protein